VAHSSQSIRDLKIAPTYDFSSAFTQNNELSRVNNLLQQIYSTEMPSTGIAHILCGEAKYWLSTYRTNVADLSAYIGGDALYG